MKLAYTVASANADNVAPATKSALNVTAAPPIPR